MSALERRMVRLGSGVSFYAKGRGPRFGMLRPVDADGERWQFVVFQAATGKAPTMEVNGRAMEVVELWQADLPLLRRICVGYYRALARHWGPARQFLHLK